jgi:hypothetical protein
MTATASKPRLIQLDWSMPGTLSAAVAQ